MAVAKGSAHTHVIMSPLLVKKVVVMMDSRTSSVRGPQICSQTHSLESIFILTVLVLQVIDLGLEVLDFLVELEDGLPNVLGIQLVVVGELRDH